MKLNIFTGIGGMVIGGILGFMFFFICGLILCFPLLAIDMTFGTNMIDNIFQSDYIGRITGCCLLLGMIIGFIVGLFQKD